MQKDTEICGNISVPWTLAGSICKACTVLSGGTVFQPLMVPQIRVRFFGFFSSWQSSCMITKIRKRIYTLIQIHCYRLSTTRCYIPSTDSVVKQTTSYTSWVELKTDATEENEWTRDMTNKNDKDKRCKWNLDVRDSYLSRFVLPFVTIAMQFVFLSLVTTPDESEGWHVAGQPVSTTVIR